MPLHDRLTPPRSTPSMRSVCGQRWNNVRIIWTAPYARATRTIRATRWHRKADTLALRRYGSDEVRVICDRGGRQNAATLNSSARKSRASSTGQGDVGTRAALSRWVGEECVGTVGPFSRAIWEQPRGAARLLERSSRGRRRGDGRGDHLIMPFHSASISATRSRRSLTRSRSSTALRLWARRRRSSDRLSSRRARPSASSRGITPRWITSSTKLTEGKATRIPGGQPRKSGARQEFHQREGILEQRRRAWARRRHCLVGCAVPAGRAAQG